MKFGFVVCLFGFLQVTVGEAKLAEPENQVKMMKHQQQVKKLAKFLAYVLGRRPDEFGLCPDEDGYVRIKELMKAIGEEEGWKHVRQSHLREVMAALPSSPIEMEGKRIRAVDRGQIAQPSAPATLPKLLYHPVRQRAYPVVLEYGVRPSGPGRPIILSNEKPMAERLGRRVDPNPIILTVNTDQLTHLGIDVRSFGSTLFLATSLPAGSFSGPPLPKQAVESKPADKSPPEPSPKTPGGYFMDLTKNPAAKKEYRKKGRRQKNEWKRERKHRHRW